MNYKNNLGQDASEKLQFATHNLVRVLQHLIPETGEFDALKLNCYGS